MLHGLELLLGQALLLLFILLFYLFLLLLPNPFLLFLSPGAF